MILPKSHFNFITFSSIVEVIAYVYRIRNDSVIFRKIATTKLSVFISLKFFYMIIIVLDNYVFKTFHLQCYFYIRNFYYFSLNQKY